MPKISIRVVCVNGKHPCHLKLYILLQRNHLVINHFPWGLRWGEGGNDRPCISYVQVCAAANGMVFEAFWSEMGYRFETFWSERLNTGFGFGFYRNGYGF